MPGMTDRDYFAAAALTGLLFHNHEPPKPALWWVEQAFDYADAMLRERERTNLDAAPAAIAGTPGTGDTDHGASPEAIARTDADRGRTDKADFRPGKGTGDTQEPVAWGVVYPNDEVAVIAFKRKDAEERATASDRVVPLYRHPPVTEPMPKEKRAEVCAEPAAWYVRNRAAGPPMLFWDEERAKTAAFACGVGARPLYLCQDFSQKNWTLTDAEREAVEFAIAHGETVDAAWRYALRGLLERMR